MSEVVKEVRRQNDAIVVVVAGEITIHESPEFHKRLLDLCRESPARLIVNLAQVSHIDSSGVGTLVDIYRRMREAGAVMSLVGLTPMVRNVLEITRLIGFFNVFDSEQEAMQA